MHENARHDLAVPTALSPRLSNYVDLKIVFVWRLFDTFSNGFLVLLLRLHFGLDHEFHSSCNVVYQELKDGAQQKWNRMQILINQGESPLIFQFSQSSLFGFLIFAHFLSVT